jgi:hypothetical protein
MALSMMSRNDVRTLTDFMAFGHSSMAFACRKSFGDSYAFYDKRIGTLPACHPSGRVILAAFQLLCAK